MEGNNKLNQKAFQEYLDCFIRDPDNQEAARFLFRLFNLWLTFFFIEYRKRWGKNTIDREDEKDLRQEIVRKFFDIIKVKHFERYSQARRYLYKMFLRTSIDRIQDKKNRLFLRFEEEADAEFPIIPSFDGTTEFDDEDIYELIEPYWRKALDRSQSSTRTIITLLKQKTPQAIICLRLGIPDCSASVFNQRVYRAKKSFKKTLLKILLDAISKKGTLNSVEYEIIKELCGRMKKKISRRRYF